MADAAIAGNLAILAGGAGAVAAAVFGAWFKAKKESDADKPTAVLGGLVDSRAVRDMTDAMGDLRRTVAGASQDFHADTRDLREDLRRLSEMIERNTEASRLDALPESIREPLRKLDQP